MSAIGTKRTCETKLWMSAFGVTADIVGANKSGAVLPSKPKLVELFHYPKLENEPHIVGQGLLSAFMRGKLRILVT